VHNVTKLYILSTIFIIKHNLHHLVAGLLHPLYFYSDLQGTTYNVNKNKHNVLNPTSNMILQNLMLKGWIHVH
jgi:hypothetical protein